MTASFCTWIRYRRALARRVRAHQVAGYRVTRECYGRYRAEAREEAARGRRG